MSGRNSIPIEFKILEGNPNRLTKRQIKERQAAKIKIGDDGFTMPKSLKGKKFAEEKWLWLIQLFKEAKEAGFDLVSTGDTGVIERYCLTYDEYNTLQELRNEIKKEMKGDIRKEFLKATTINLETNINKKAEMLLQMEGHLYLTPLTKARNIIKQNKQKVEEDPLKKMGFENV
jgi:phage terminase small subunit